MPLNQADDKYLNGMRIFVRINKTNIDGTIDFEIYDSTNKLESTIKVVRFNSRNDTFDAGDLLEGTIREFIFFRSQDSSHVFNNTSTFRLKIIHIHRLMQLLTLEM
ncbi:hypothetical protein AGMMS49936_09950 [Endomicrobiia bacterium]|nr:hypothetical protein AGMMS49936_09950 [Endomicrobiia bacterium]